MQIAAAKPEYLDREAVPSERLEKEMEILKAQAMNEGKPEAIAEKNSTRKNWKILFRNMLSRPRIC